MNYPSSTIISLHDVFFSNEEAFAFSDRQPKRNTVSCCHHIHSKEEPESNASCWLSREHGGVMSQGSPIPQRGNEAGVDMSLGAIITRAGIQYPLRNSELHHRQIGLEVPWISCRGLFFTSKSAQRHKIGHSRPTQSRGCCPYSSSQGFIGGTRLTQSLQETRRQGRKYHSTETPKTSGFVP